MSDANMPSTWPERGEVLHRERRSHSTQHKQNPLYNYKTT